MRAAALIVVLAASVARAEAPVTVGVDLSKLDGVAPADTITIEQALVARLVQEGFAVVPLTSTPSIVLAITARTGGFVVAAKTAQFDRSRDVDASGTGAHLELLQKAVELARLAAESIPPAPAIAATPITAPATPAIEDVAPVPRPEPCWAIGLDGGALVRGGGTDAELALHARYALRGRFGIVLRASGTSSTENDVEVRELHALIGPAYELPLAPKIALGIAVLAGVRHHDFETSMEIGEPSGGRFDPELAAPLRIGWRPVRAFEASVFAITSVATAREHVLGNRKLWQRDAVGIALGIGVTARF
jgi:hypothetical protein